jgi:hypothetical protein
MSAPIASLITIAALLGFAAWMIHRSAPGLLRELFRPSPVITGWDAEEVPNPRFPSLTELIITVHTDRGDARYRGSSTVWHAYPSGQRASSSMEMRLSGYARSYEWRKQAPEGKP